MAAAQSEAQGEHVYGRNGWAAVAANLVTKLYSPPLADFDAERLSRIMGTSAGEEVAWSRGWGAAGTRRGEHRRAIPVPLAHPEILREGARAGKILVRFANLPPAWLWCPPYDVRPEYHGRISDERTTTADLAVYHHLWTAGRRTNTSPARGADAAAAPLSGHAPRNRGEEGSPQSVPEAATESKAPAEGDGAGAGSSGLPDDEQHLNQIVKTLVARALRDEGATIRVVQNGGRPVEVRVRPDVMLEVCRGADAMHALARRWSALRWVRRVRPTFVLSRRALQVLDPRLLAELRAACGAGSMAGSSAEGRADREACRAKSAESGQCGSGIQHEV